MTMKEHLDNLTQEQENGVTLTDEEVTTRKEALLKDAKNEVVSLIFVASLLKTAMESLAIHIQNEDVQSKKCLEIIDQLHHKDVEGE